VVVLVWLWCGLWCVLGFSVLVCGLLLSVVFFLCCCCWRFVFGVRCGVGWFFGVGVRVCMGCVVFGCGVDLSGLLVLVFVLLVVFFCFLLWFFWGDCVSLSVAGALLVCLVKFRVRLCFDLLGWWG